MILNLENLINKWDLRIRGVIHIGAHVGGELPIYEKTGIPNMIFFEPNPESFKQLKDKVGDRAHNCALGDIDTGCVLKISDNNGQSSTLLSPHVHTYQYPHVKFDRYLMVKVKQLDSIEFRRNDFNFINIDTEGYELKVFQGAIKTLPHIDYVYSEVTRAELRHGNAMVWEVDAFLGEFGFKRVETSWAGGTWGDALYIK